MERERQPHRFRRPGAARGLADLVVLSLALVFAAESPLGAYIDPGSGALIWQAILAAFFGGAFYFRRFLGRLTFWKKGEKIESDDASE
jgi:hypothetical protein